MMAAAREVLVSCHYRNGEERERDFGSTKTRARLLRAYAASWIEEAASQRCIHGS